MPVLKTIYRFLMLINITALVSVPALGLANGDWFHEQIDLATLSEGRAIFLALEDVDLETLPDVTDEKLMAFVGSHITIPAPEDQTHIHGMIDTCCNIGGLVCDAGVAPLFLATLMPKPFLSKYVGATMDLFGVKIPPLYHPPKIQTTQV